MKAKTLLTAMMVIGSMWALQGCSESPLEPERPAAELPAEQPADEDALRQELPEQENPAETRPDDLKDRNQGPTKVN